jgi:hypothetical protein
MVVPVIAWWRTNRRALIHFFAAAATTVVVGLAITLTTVGVAPLQELAQSWFLYVTEPGPLHQGKLSAARSVTISLREGLYISGIGILLPLYLVRVRHPQTREQSLMLWWSIAALAGTLTSTRFYSHYFFLAIPAVLAAILAFPPRPVRWVNAVAAVLAAYFAVRSAQFMVHNASFDRREVARIVHTTNAIEGALGPGAVIEADEEPGLLLAAHARTRTPYDIAIGTNQRFVTRATSGNSYPKTDVWLVTHADTVLRAHGAHVCQLDGWRLFVRNDLARRFTPGACVASAQR